MLYRYIVSFGFLLAVISNARADAITISPVRLSLSEAQSVTSLTVYNDGPTPKIVQLDLYAWQQHSGRDIYTPTREILATPPIFTISPKSSQLVRIGARRSVSTSTEIAYRLYLQEVLPELAAKAQGLRIALRLGVPIFITPSTPSKPQLRWQAKRGADGEVALSATNTGNVHMQIAALQFGPTTKEPRSAEQNVNTYLLPGQSHTWPLPVETRSTLQRLQLLARTDAGDISAEIPFDAK